MHRKTPAVTSGVAACRRIVALLALSGGILAWPTMALDPGAAPNWRGEGPPRKVVLGAVLSGYEIYTRPLEERLRRMDELLDAMAAQAASRYAGKRLDLVVFPEAFVARPGKTLAERAVRLEEVQAPLAACARRHGCYLITPLLLREADPARRISNAALLWDRDGRLVGVYRKVHPVAAVGTDVLEEGTAPGRGFPVFACDFGRVGIQICWDMLYPDGWQALAAQGAEIVALPTASPETAHPSMYALQHHYYIVSAAPRDHAAVYNPVGVVEAEAGADGVLVHQIDLSFAVVHWADGLDGGEALRRRYGDKVGFHYYDAQDAGIFWSNDPAMPIARMLGSLGFSERTAEVERDRMLQDRARGGPPAAP